MHSTSSSYAKPRISSQKSSSPSCPAAFSYSVLVFFRNHRMANVTFSRRLKYFTAQSPLKISAIFTQKHHSQIHIQYTAFASCHTFQSISKMKLLLCLSALLTYAIAAPILPDETSRTFRLKSLALAPSNSSFSNLYLEPYYIYSGANFAVLSPKTPTNPGIIGYLNGTAEDFAHENTDFLFNFNPAPYGFIIDSVNATYNPILINAGNGTKGIFIDQGIIKYHNPISGGFYGKETLPAKDEIEDIC